MCYTTETFEADTATTTHDLIALGADGVAITNAMRWTSPGTILRYGKKLRAKSSATARFLSGEPK